MPTAKRVTLQRMYIFIDESGSFAFPKQDCQSIACVGALTIPETCYGDVVTKFTELESSWGRSETEIKGRSLAEHEISQVINLLLENDAKFHLCLTDMAKNKRLDVVAHREDQARRLVAHLTPQHQVSLVNQFNEAASSLHSLTEQLYVQMCMMTQLVMMHLRDTSVYFAFKRPVELGAYRWVLHAKNNKPTTYEILWKRLVSCFLQTAALNKPIHMTIDGGDYSHFERFCRLIDQWPDHIPHPDPTLVEVKSGPLETIDISMIMKESFTITDALTEPGLRLADICTNAFRRSVIGNLKRDGWRNLGKLMLYLDDNPIAMIRLAVDQRDIESLVGESLTRKIAQVTSGAQCILPTL